MFWRVIVFLMLCISTIIQGESRNKIFKGNVLVNKHLHARTLSVSTNAEIENLTVPNATISNILGNLLATKNVTIIGDLTVGGIITSPTSVNSEGFSTVNAVARFANTSGTVIKDSPVLVDDTGNIEIYGITKNGFTVNWPSTTGSVGTFLGSDGAGNLIYATPLGGGNVSTVAPFGSDNAILTTDLPNGAENIKQTNVYIDSSNNITGINTLTAVTVHAELNGNATTATDFTGSLSGDVSGPQNATVVNTVGGQSAANIAATTTTVNAATSSNTPNTIVKRDGSGNFSAGTITANITGNVTGDLTGNATTATDFTGSLSGDVSGPQNTTVVNTVGGQSAANIATATTAANAATSTNSSNTIVKRDGSGNFSAGTITANITGNVTGNLTGNADTATSATTATDFTGSLSGDVSGPQNATVVNTVGGQSAANIAAATVTANAATPTNTPNTIVKRDGSGNFSAGTITANITGNITGNLTGNADTATSATTATNFTGSLTGDVSGTQSATVVSFVGGESAANVATATIAANNATSDNTAGTIVRRDGSGNFNAGTITANVTGNVTGDLSGNATTATNATNATTAINFSGALSGDVSGTQSATTVSAVGGQSAANVATATIAANAATENDSANTIVKRNSSGNFTTNMITLNGTITNPTDVTTKEYVDTAVSTGIVPKEPSRVVSQTDISLTGTQIVDSIVLTVGDRVLVLGQTNQIENGLWVVQNGAWTRPTDFASSTEAQGAYVLTTSGNTQAGTSWLCNTPTAIIDTDPITFVQFSSPGQTTAANVGTGDGHLFRDKTGITLNFKTLAAGLHMIVTNNTNDVTLTTDATSVNTPNTIAARDGTGTIAANLTGSASNNVLKVGDTMTGNLNLANQSEIRLQDTAGGEYVGLQAPTTIGTSYTIALPGTAPTAGQYLKALSSYATTWTVVDAPPVITKTYYVALNGDDSNDGSLSAPFLTIKHAVNEANLVASSSNPVTISIGAGTFVEDNSGGAITITADGISLVGSSIESTVIKPSDISTDLFHISASTLVFSDFSLIASVGSTANAVTMDTSSFGRSHFYSISISLFQTGFNASSSAVSPPINIFENIQFAGNGTCISLNNAQAIIRASYLRGPLSGPATNTGITLTGTKTATSIFNNVFSLLNSALSITGGAAMRVFSCEFESTIQSITCSGGSFSQLLSLNFILNSSTSINVAASGADTRVYITGCLFDCEDAAEAPQGTAIQATTEASIIVNASTIEEAVIGIKCGAPGDTETTAIKADAVNIIDCSTAIQQIGSSRIYFVAGTFDSTALTIEDPTNVYIAAFNSNNDEAHLAIGDSTDDSSIIYQIENGQIPQPKLIYEPNYYGHKGTVYKNQLTNPTCNATQAQSNNARYYVVTGSRDKEASLNLISDTGNMGIEDNVRGWTINKLGTSADLAFTYTNNDTSGQLARGPNSVLLLNGFDNQVEFPTATNPPLPTNTTAKLVWADDTNLYRDSAHTLKTDDDLIIAGLTASKVVVTDANKKLTSSATTDTELGYLSGVTSSIQTQLDGKVNKTGDTMTGALQLPAGTTSLPTLNFTDSTTTGLSANSNNLSLSSAGAERMKIASSGAVSINAFNTAGIVRNDASGNLSSSLIVNNDIDAAAGIEDTKLATISTASKVANSATTATSTNTPNTIVARDASGNFSAGTITGNLSGAASDNVLKAGDTMTGTLTLAAGTAASPSLQFTGSTNTGISAEIANTLSFDTNGTERLSISTTDIKTIAKLILTNIMCNQAIQAVAPTPNGTVIVNSTTSILLLTHPAARNNVTIVFPPSPTNGQLFTILLGTTFPISLINNGNGASVVNAITGLNPATNFTATANGASVTYFYYAAANTWYRCNRG